MIYLDHNATTPLHPQVLDAMMPYLGARWGNPSGPYRFGAEARQAVEKARQRLAECIGCKATEVVFCSSGTEANNLALRGVLLAQKHKGSHVVTSMIEHPSILNTCKALEKEGCRISYLPVNQDGVVEVQALSECLGSDTVLVALMHANNETGVLQPVDALAVMAKECGVVFLTDAVQSAGKWVKPLAEINADLISISGHKIYGPKGIAALVVREGTPISSILTGGGHERGLRAGTENVAGIIGLAEAMKRICAHAKTENQRLERLRDRLESQVRSMVPNVTVNGAKATRLPNTSNLSFDFVDGESIALGLDMCGVCASTGSACSTGQSDPSHVLLAMGLTAQEAQGSVRFSLGYETREKDIDTAVEALVKTVKRLRSISSL
jgi:cysteine desulfurase